jgi:uncharacterized repeat protein (TIGR03987 family)
MKPITIAASTIVTFALISYSVGISGEYRHKILSRKVLLFLAIGLILDISGTVLMIIGSTRNAFTVHGLIGYSGLLAMFIDNAIFWGLWKTKGINSSVPRKVHMYSLFAYFWWVIVYISGAVMAASR